MTFKSREFLGTILLLLCAVLRQLKSNRAFCIQENRTALECRQMQKVIAEGKANAPGRTRVDKGGGRRNKTQIFQKAIYWNKSQKAETTSDESRIAPTPSPNHVSVGVSNLGGLNGICTGEQPGEEPTTILYPAPLDYHENKFAPPPRNIQQ